MAPKPWIQCYYKFPKRGGWSLGWGGVSTGELLVLILLWFQPHVLKQAQQQEIMNRGDSPSRSQRGFWSNHSFSAKNDKNF